MDAKKFFVFLAGVALLAFAQYALAHGMMSWSDARDSSGMMQFMEEQALGDEAHEEMEVLMGKMMAGTMSEDEAGRMAELMNQYPGPMGMMLQRLNGRTGVPDSSGINAMMSWMGMGSGFSGFWGWTVGLNAIVWLIAGILLSVWLWRALVK